MSPKETSEITLTRFSLRLIRKGFHRFVLLGQMFYDVWRQLGRKMASGGAHIRHRRLIAVTKLLSEVEVKYGHRM